MKVKFHYSPGRGVWEDRNSGVSMCDWADEVEGLRTLAAGKERIVAIAKHMGVAVTADDIEIELVRDGASVVGYQPVSRV